MAGGRSARRWGILLAASLLSLPTASERAAVELPDVPISPGVARRVHLDFSASTAPEVRRARASEALRTAVNLSVPTLFTGGLVSDWASLERWADPEYLDAAFSGSVSVKVSQTPTFMLFAKDPRRPDAMQGGSVQARSQRYRWEDMDVGSIFNTSSSFHYFSGEVPAAASSDVNLSDLEVDMLNHGNMTGCFGWGAQASLPKLTMIDLTIFSPKSSVAFMAARGVEAAEHAS